MSTFSVENFDANDFEMEEMPWIQDDEDYLTGCPVCAEPYTQFV